MGKGVYVFSKLLLGFDVIAAVLQEAVEGEDYVLQFVLFFLGGLDNWVKILLRQVPKELFFLKIRVKVYIVSLHIYHKLVAFSLIACSPLPLEGLML